MSTLKPCPFCGEKDIKMDNNENHLMYVQCLRCGCKYGYTITEQKIIESWNQRPAIDPISDMTINMARTIREVKKGCTYRRLAEIFWPEDHEYHDSQGMGEELCRKALKLLYPNDDVWMMDFPEEKFGPLWEKENKSHYGDFFWWE